MLTEQKRPVHRVTAKYRGGNGGVDPYTRSENHYIQYQDLDSGDNLTTEWMRITPELAQDMLDQTEKIGFKNRRLKPWKVEQYIRDLQAGSWKVTNQTLGVLANGAVIDGQHRLHAIAKSGIAVVILVVKGLGVDSFPFIDIGVARSLADTFRLDNRKNCAQLAAVGKLLAHYLNGNLIDGGSYTRPTNQECLVALENFPEIAEWVDRFKGTPNSSRYVRIPIASSTVTIARINMPEVPKQKYIDFWDELTEHKLPSSMLSPVIAYRRRFGTPEDRRKFTFSEQQRAFAWALKNYLDGREIKSFQVPKNFPDFLK